MTDMYRYTRRRLLGAKPERQVFIDLFTKRVIKSMSRVAAARIHKNKWLVIIKTLSMSMQDQSWIEEIREVSQSLRKRAPLGSARLNFMLDVIAQDNSNHGLIDVFGKHFEILKQQVDQGFVIGVAMRYGIQRADCGHFATNTRKVLGTEETYNHQSLVCQTCAEELVSSGARVQSSYMYSDLILPAFAVEARAESTLVLVDKRNPLFTFSERRGFWHHLDWSPYQDLIGCYHSSKRKGFQLIHSDWFKSNRRAFGCELEVQTTKDPNGCAGRVHDALNPSGVAGEYCYFEQDGSIGTGFEMVTQPAGLDVHREKFSLFLENKDIKRNMRSHEGGSCGFHVHVGREYLSQSQIFRMQAFLNDVRNESLIKKIARRYNSGYSRFKPNLGKISPRDKLSRDRYEALNVSGEHTVEFRIFRGSLRYESIMAALEFVNALCMFCSPGTTSIFDFTAVGFKQFIERPDIKSDTKYLRSYLSPDERADQENIQQAA